MTKPVIKWIAFRFPQLYILNNTVSRYKDEVYALQVL